MIASLQKKNLPKKPLCKVMDLFLATAPDSSDRQHGWLRIGFLESKNGFRNCTVKG
jgi:hypothetical protein